jgi:hypothetical protein
MVMVWSTREAKPSGAARRFSSPSEILLRRLLRAGRRAFDEARLLAAVLPHRLAGAGRRPRRHDLPAALVVSLTSWPPRFPFLHRTLRSLLRQSVRADRIVLWIAADDAPLLPAKVLRLRRRGVEIRTTADTGPLKKLLPSLETFPGAFVATADDDVHYGPAWLEALVSGFLAADEPAIVCHRAHRPWILGDGAVAPYSQWERDVQDGAARRASGRIVPIGVGGILYPPDSLDPLVADSAIAARLCPTCDDFWFFWMARRRGTRVRKIGGRFPYREWPGSQRRALHTANLGGDYDRQLAALSACLGVPAGLAEPARP